MLLHGPKGASFQNRIIPEVTLLPACHQHVGSASAQMLKAAVFTCPLFTFPNGRQSDCVAVPQVVLS